MQSQNAEADVTMYEGAAIGVQLPQKMVFQATDNILDMGYFKTVLKDLSAKPEDPPPPPVQNIYRCYPSRELIEATRTTVDPGSLR